MNSCYLSTRWNTWVIIFQWRDRRGWTRLIYSCINTRVISLGNVILLGLSQVYGTTVQTYALLSCLDVFYRNWTRNKWRQHSTYKLHYPCNKDNNGDLYIPMGHYYPLSYVCFKQILQSSLIIKDVFWINHHFTVITLYFSYTSVFYIP